MIEVEDLSHRYGQGSGPPALQGVSFAVSQGEIFGMLGPNGGGKTTLFRILVTLVTPASGRVQVFGHDLSHGVQRVRQRIGVVFQSQSLDSKLTVSENLKHQGHLHGLSGFALRRRIQELLSQFELTARATERVETLSGGLKRRLELAKALLHKPDLLIMDEPSTGLDPGARADFWKYIQNLNRKEALSIFLTTHIMDEAEKCDRLGILNQGQLVALDSPESLKNRVRGEVIVVQTEEPQQLSMEIQEKFPGRVTVIDNSVRIERTRGHEFIAVLVEAFPGRIRSITLSKPTLEDVFIDQTGHGFHSQDTGVTARAKH